MSQTLEKQEQCDASVEKLVVGLTGMLPYLDQIDKAAKLVQLQKTVASMMNLIEDAARFVVEYKSGGGPGTYSYTVYSTRAGSCYS